MTNYSDYRVWKEVELYENGQEYLSENNEYSFDDLKHICDQLFVKAEAEGLEGCFLKFQSHMESYEDYLGSPSVTVCGYRKLNAAERKETQDQDDTQKMADEMGITFYEAGILKKLKAEGKL